METQLSILRVSYSPAEAGAIIEFRVEDSGPGMPPEAVDAVRSKPFGLGIGLTISREIVELHGGELRQGTSDELGGAQFTIRLHLPIIESSEPTV